MNVFETNSKKMVSMSELYRTLCAMASELGGLRTVRLILVSRHESGGS